MTFIVKDIEKSSKLMTYLFEAEEIYDSNEKNFSLSREKFFLINDLWIVLMEGDSKESKSYNHVAFKINQENFYLYMKRINDLKLEIKPDRGRIKEESSSVYFYDYDNHLFELHTGTLEERLKRYSNYNL